MKFGYKISRHQVFKLFTSKKKDSVSWKDHMMFLMAVSDAVGGAPDQVLEKIAKYACSPSLFQGALLALLNPAR